MSGQAVDLDVHVEARDLRVAMSLQRGESVSLLGPNGAGKSSLLGVLAGLVRPDAGLVALGERRLDAPAERVHVPTHRRRVGLLAQDAALFPHLDVLSNVAFASRTTGRRGVRARQHALAWLERVGAAALADRRPHTLSGGQRQRVAVARMLAAEPELVLLDEPMSGLDADAVPQMREALRAALAGRTCVIATHDPLDALLLTSRAVVVEAGRVTHDGPVDDVLARPLTTFAANLSGLTVARGTWTGDGLALPSGGTVWGLPQGDPPPPGSPALAAFSPRAVSVLAHPGPGSPRNVIAGRLTSVTSLGGLVRVTGMAEEHELELCADVTPRGAAAVAAAPGVRVWFSIKAAEVSIYSA